ncbi:hypothetical protein A3H22_02110 [Candidatus Peribacteria bacterium RIFCSPLOWO2_12_FULL_55_15]|nr:MAG: hypothetical protein A2789_03635 [Candidatus Peribacteria bacterium RIFCSPHIGHO2_01_FULL_54_22]OGJ62948.1 MAG: hypothetical protein A3D12_04500 [Candidatus Peribacteria bacterium RIFCSPHIGHO2_02_FULL_55_24]OGJ64850.1 MAG: hypothetical protein A3E47_01645 [Candidatus Peribacteria bacterium RIFCSPHIGHO2_12_FULL_54_10]OGJ69125.1 MAG: hypothetical protein A3H90_00585 [Candidatus Peribacteria bacterium RIFCSPLOWO2_02_FULL_55_36]OGJ70774.1 MAG: hypothetical protein A3H22_02110 [Candidatus Per
MSNNEKDPIVSAINEKIHQLRVDNKEVGWSRALEAAIKMYEDKLKAVLEGKKDVRIEIGRMLGVTDVEPGATPLISPQVIGNKTDLTEEQYNKSFQRGLQEGGGGRLDK